MNGNELVGAWRWAGEETHWPDGRVTYPRDPETIGYLLYTDAGFVSATVMPGNRPRFADAVSLAQGSVEERLGALQSYLSYVATYELDGDNLIHHITASLFPNQSGTDLVRRRVVDGDRMRLIQSGVRDGVAVETHIIWQRVRPGT